MLKVYPAIIHNDDGIWVEFPDLEGCQTVGDTIEDAIENASEALGLYLITLLENGQAIPDASDIGDISASDGRVAYISADIKG